MSEYADYPGGDKFRPRARRGDITIHHCRCMSYGRVLLLWDAN